MLAAIAAIVGFVIGAAAVFALLDSRRRYVASMMPAINGLKMDRDRLEAEREEFEKVVSEHSAAKAEFDARHVAYSDLSSENYLLKKNQRAVEVQLRKLQLDRDELDERQTGISGRCEELAKRYLKDTEKWVGASLTSNNYALCKQRLVDAIERCRDIGFEFSKAEEDRLIAELKADFEKEVRAAVEREEQARIKAQIREEAAREREIQREMDRVDRERAAIQAALDRALADAKNEHGAEIERLRARLAEAEQNQRKLSQAQWTKAGYIYVISNVGAFGDRVFKVGMTRRLEPLERVQELSDASVPFPFDVHMMISCENAPSLERKLHEQLHDNRVNRVNPRKEFFRASLDEIRAIVETHHGQVDYTVDAEALEYRQSQTMSNEDQDVIDEAFRKAESSVGLTGEEED